MNLETQVVYFFKYLTLLLDYPNILDFTRGVHDVLFCSLHCFVLELSLSCFFLHSQNEDIWQTWRMFKGSSKIDYEGWLSFLFFMGDPYSKSASDTRFIANSVRLIFCHNISHGSNFTILQFRMGNSGILT